MLSKTKSKQLFITKTNVFIQHTYKHGWGDLVHARLHKQCHVFSFLNSKGYVNPKNCTTEYLELSKIRIRIDSNFVDCISSVLSSATVCKINT